MAGIAWHRVIGVLCVGCLLADPGLAQTAAARAPRALDCVPGVIRVADLNPRDASDACEGARSALAFLTSLGLPAGDPFSIQGVNAMPSQVDRSAAGCFIERQRRVLVLPYERFRRFRTWFGLPIDRRLYRSLVTHEAAHALAACHFARPDPPLHAKEYIAYVITFATMDESLRAKALARIPGDGFDSEDRITLLLALFDPMRFGAQAYRHYRMPGQGAEFLRAILAGRVLVD